MNRIHTLVVLSAFMAHGAIIAGEQTAPEDLGAHWAKVSDRAQVEMIADELRSVADGMLAPSVVRAQGLEVSRMVNTSTGRRSAAAVITIASDNATISYADGSTVSLSKTNGRWQVTGGDVVPRASVADDVPLGSSATVESVGETFIATAVSREYGIDRLSKSVTREKLDRSLFGVPEKTASYYKVHYAKTAPYVTSTYLQIVTDPVWNRLIYGNLNRGIKAYDDVRGPSAVAVDPAGRVFVGEKGRNRVSVFTISGNGDAATLQRLFTIDDIAQPSDIALSDNGTPLVITDDLLYVADASANKVYKYSLDDRSAVRTATFEGFDSPTAIAVGRWNGANNGLLYVIDHVAKRVRLFQDNGTELVLIKELNGRYDQYFSSAKIDHFGQVYIVDNIRSTVSKFTSSLGLLDSEGGRDVYSSISHIDIPFGRIDIDGQESTWTGFDQLFALERWGENSGVQRRTLGLALRDVVFTTDQDVSSVESRFMMTDFADVHVTIVDSENVPVRHLSSGWMVSGGKTIQWDRRDDSGAQVPGGEYRYDIEAQSGYAETPVTLQTRFALPLYYWEDAGSSLQADDAHLVQGSAVRWGNDASRTANENASSVQYRFTGLNPGSEYSVAAEYVAHDGARRLQDMTANGIRIHEPVSVSEVPTRTGYLKIPKKGYSDGELLISVNKRAEGSAIVSQLWLKETGAAFEAHSVNKEIPTSYALEQNYPNPFNPSTLIRFSLPRDGNTTLKVYDITGRVVATLVDEFRNAGAYVVSFDSGSGGKVLSSGVYFYTVKSGSFAKTRKMVLIK